MTINYFRYVCFLVLAITTPGSGCGSYKYEVKVSRRRQTLQNTHKISSCVGFFGWQNTGTKLHLSTLSLSINHRCCSPQNPRVQSDSDVVPQIDPSVPQPIVQSRRRPLLGPSPGWNWLLPLSHLTLYCRWVDISTQLLQIREAIKKKIYNQNVRTHLSSDY